MHFKASRESLKRTISTKGEFELLQTCYVSLSRKCFVLVHRSVPGFDVICNNLSILLTYIVDLDPFVSLRFRKRVKYLTKKVGLKKLEDALKALYKASHQKYSST